MVASGGLSRSPEAMTAPDLTFSVEGAEPLPHAASPHIVFKLAVTNPGGQTIHSVILRCQLQLEAARRRYTDEEQKQLTDLFGQPDQWAQTLHSMHWTHASVIIPPFSHSTSIDLPVPCSFDFNAAATKYFAGLTEGEIPVTFLFSGTIFYATSTSPLQVTQISWNKESAYRLPVQVWRQMMDLYYPDSVWMCIRRDAFERLNTFKTERGMPTFEDAIAEVLP